MVEDLKFSVLLFIVWVVVGGTYGYLFSDVQQGLTAGIVGGMAFAGLHYLLQLGG